MVSIQQGGAKYDQLYLFFQLYMRGAGGGDKDVRHSWF